LVERKLIMFHKSLVPVLLAFSLVLSGCATPTPVFPTVSPTETAVPPTPIPPTATQPPATATPLPTQAPTATTAPTATSTAAPVVNPSKDNYIDDRSTPSQVIVSYFNAINRQEYSRAYGYWRDPANSLGNFNAFVNGYQDTASVDLVFGQITGDAGAGQMYYTVPVILKAVKTNNVQANWSACYVLHMSQPGNFGAPPIIPMAIIRGSATSISLNTNDDTVLASACSGETTGGNEVSATGTSLDISKDNYLDNRSGPLETISSLLNSLNLKQYVRAYSYYSNTVAYPGSYTSYAAGYSDTDTITATFGTIQSEGAAGSIYYTVPLAMKVTTTSNATQTFVGCYTLRLAQPAVQAAPPFHPMSITAGEFKQVDNNVDVNPMLSTACN
jgi:hypothetical protein